MSAAPSAGTRNANVNTVDDSWIIGDARITTSAPISDATTKLPAASTRASSRAAPRPSRSRPQRGCARPHRVNRENAQTAAAMNTTMPASQRPSRGTVTPSAKVTGSRGRIASTRSPAVVGEARSIREMNTITRPMLATTFASAGARSSGRNTAKNTTRPEHHRREQRERTSPTGTRRRRRSDTAPATRGSGTGTHP